MTTLSMAHDILSRRKLKYVRWNNDDVTGYDDVFGYNNLCMRIISLTMHKQTYHGPFDPHK